MFQRADQFSRFRAYVRGLLESQGRKNVEAIAAAAEAVMTVEANLAQALQHFISNSPWDAAQFLACLREQSRPMRQDPAARWVVHDAVFVKKGRHSVGVHRQLARSLGRKVNCQVGVVLAQVGPDGYFPLATRLYLPSAWLRDNADTARRHIPETDRVARTRGQIAMDLLVQTRNSGELARPVSVDVAYESDELACELAERGFITQPGEFACFREWCEWLASDFGLDHFEGRNWLGWHHHTALVFAATHFAMTQPNQEESRMR